MNSIGITVEDLKLFSIEPGFFNEFSSAETVLEGGAAVQISHSSLDKRAEVARGSVCELHDTAGLTLKENHAASADVTCLHRVQLPAAEKLGQ